MTEPQEHIKNTHSHDDSKGGIEPSSSAEKTKEKSVLSWMGLGLIAFVLVIFYIYNQMHAIKSLKRKETLTREVKELKAEYISIQKDLREKSKQSEIAKKLEPVGVKELTNPPVKLELKVKKK